MSVNTSSVALALLGLVVSAACGGSSSDVFSASTGATGAGATGGTNGSGSGGSSSGSSGTGGNRTNPTSTTGPKFTGSGTGYIPLTPGCGPATASECTGTCEATAAADPSTIIRPPATLCFGGAGDPTPENPLATIEQVIETIGGKRMIHLRVTFDPSFVDNTYGANACCGWPEAEENTDMPMDPDMMPGMMPGKMPKPGKGGHTFNDLVGSDHLELLLTNGAGDTVMDFKVDYISEDASSDCGYRTLGVTGGEGKMILGDASAVLGASTSFDRDLNGCGYCYTTDSPATDENYTPNPDTPAWDYRVVYEVWIDLDAFGSAGFGQAYINSVHASPSKLDTNTVEVSATPCPGDWDTPMGDSCPQNWTVYVQSEGKSSCVPIPFSNYPDMKPCPEGYQLDAATEGKYCIPL